MSCQSSVASPVSCVCYGLLVDSVIAICKVTTTWGVDLLENIGVFRSPYKSIISIPSHDHIIATPRENEIIIVPAIQII
eukprot:scaffold1190_cov393-Prasinococcus_capsulatus_cf.AAC.1